MDRYEIIKDIGYGNFGVAKLVMEKATKNLFAIKFIERGPKVDEQVLREIINHRSLKHPNIIEFKEVLLTPTHLGIVMEYAAGGELFHRICEAGRFSEDEARFFFQHLISGISHCHSMNVCHRDLKLENTLLDGSKAPRVKICDFGYSKLYCIPQPKSTVGTPAYIAPEILQRNEYDGRRIFNLQYSIPDYVRVSEECRHLLSRIFVLKPNARITIAEIREHPWFIKNLPVELTASMLKNDTSNPSQTVEEVLSIVQEARQPKAANAWENLRSLDADELDEDDVDIDSESDVDDYAEESMEHVLKTPL